ncbi:MAG: hypothetical protein ACOC3X_03955 [Nanoarchaeota archaeon]
MNDEIKKDVINVLKKSFNALTKNNSQELRELSNHTLHNISIYQDKDSINIAIFTYALSKLIERNSENTKIIDLVKCAKENLENDKINEYEECLSKAINLISKIDKKMNLYVKHILNQAGIKKGSKVYAHGISLARTAEILNISQWELMKFLGNTNIADSFEEEIDICDRMKYAKKIFNIKNE